jgi:hypothetical protein
LEVGNGIEVDEYARTSNTNIWRPRTSRRFPELALDRRTRIEHWITRFSTAMRRAANMAGANRP